MAQLSNDPTRWALSQRNWGTTEPILTRMMSNEHDSTWFNQHVFQNMGGSTDIVFNHGVIRDSTNILSIWVVQPTSFFKCYFQITGVNKKAYHSMFFGIKCMFFLENRIKPDHSISHRIHVWYIYPQASSFAPGTQCTPCYWSTAQQYSLIV